MRFLISLLLAFPAFAQVGVPGSFFSSANGQPANCSTVAGFPAPAVCTAPGELPLGSFPVPAQGGTYSDPNFGSTVRILTPAGQNRHSYSSPTAMSTSGKYALVTLNSNTTAIIDTTTGVPVRQMARKQRSWSSGEAVWDTRSDTVLYFLSGYWNGVKWINDRLMKYDVAADVETLVQDYALAPYNFAWVARGGTGDMSKDGWLPFYTPEKVCVVQVASGNTVCAAYSNVGGLPWTFIDFVSISKGPDRSTGKHYVMMQGQPANAMFEFDPAAGTLTFQFRGPEMPSAVMGWGNGNGVCEPGESCLAQSHSDTFEDSMGNQYLVRAVQLRNPCSWVLTTMRMSAGLGMVKGVAEGGGRTDVALLARCASTPWPGLHVGCARKSPFCSISLENRPLLPSPLRDGAPYNGEIWVMRDNGAEFRRVAMHRSVIQTYYDQPRVCISDTGAKVLWDSNFGVPNSYRVVVAESGMRQLLRLVF
ncbi:MAG: hypothetical protein SFV51_12725 [Bryobacteraceae bacterium]|nr:hypothetical protein [Bryobacteraceae bacterium]